MIKIVSNIKKRLAVFLLSALLIGQGSGYLAQKLMVENNIRERILLLTGNFLPQGVLALFVT